MLRQAAVLLLLTACGGRSEQAPGSTAASGGGVGEQPTVIAGASADDATGGTTSLNSDPGGTTSGGATETALGGDASTDPQPPKIGSATRYCDNDFECFGLECSAPPQLISKVCVTGCERDDDCQPNEVCLQSASLQPGCYPRCDSSFGCANGFDCFDFANTQQMLVCFPTPWATFWIAHHL